MAQIGLETLGVAFNWSDVQPFANENEVPAAARSAFPSQGGIPTSFRVTDAEVLAAARSGMGSSPWSCMLHPGRGWIPRRTSPPADPAAYAKFMRLLVTRYGPAGTFWSAHHEVRAHPIRAWQVWNEPAGGLTTDSPSVFWDAPRPFQPRYMALLHAAHGAIKSADPGAQVVLAALVGRSWETLQTLYDSGAAPYFDTVSLHPYTGLAKNVIVILRRVRAVMQRNGDKRKPIVVSELGWPSFDGGAVSRPGERQVQQAQSEWLRDALNTLIGARAELGLRQILVYSWITRDLSSTYAFDYAGLEHLLSDGHIFPKRALAVVAKIARRIEGSAAPAAAAAHDPGVEARGARPDAQPATQKSTGSLLPRGNRSPVRRAEVPASTSRPTRQERYGFDERLSRATFSACRRRCWRSRRPSGGCAVSGSAATACRRRPCSSTASARSPVIGAP